MWLFFFHLKHDLHTASAALTYALDNGVHDADSILSAYRTITSPMQQLQPMQVQQLHQDIQDVPSFLVNNHKYDNFFTQEVVAHAG